MGGGEEEEEEEVQGGSLMDEIKRTQVSVLPERMLFLLRPYFRYRS